MDVGAATAAAARAHRRTAKDAVAADARVVRRRKVAVTAAVARADVVREAAALPPAGADVQRASPTLRSRR